MPIKIVILNYHLQCSENNVVVDHSTKMVGISDQVGDCPFVQFIAFHFCLQHLCILEHWEIQYFFAKVFGDTSNTICHCQVDPLPSRSMHLNRRRGKALGQLAKWSRRCSTLYFLNLFATWYTCFAQSFNTLNLRVFIKY